MAKLFEKDKESFYKEADNYGWTPLHWACRSVVPETILLFAKSEADLDTNDFPAWTPRRVAWYHGNKEALFQLQFTQAVDDDTTAVDSSFDEGAASSAASRSTTMTRRKNKITNESGPGMMLFLPPDSVSFSIQSPVLKRGKKQHKLCNSCFCVSLLCFRCLDQVRQSDGADQIMNRTSMALYIVAYNPWIGTVVGSVTTQYIE
jgi:hypothetical protein